MPATRCATTAFGRRAYKLARLAELGLPVPARRRAVVPTACANSPTAGRCRRCRSTFGDGRLFVLRSSPESRAWGGPSAILSLGLNAATLPGLVRRIGETGGAGADLPLHPELRRRSRRARSRGLRGARPRPDRAPTPAHALSTPSGALRRGDRRDVSRGPDADQIEGAARAMARAWNGASARMLRAGPRRAARTPASGSSCRSTRSARRRDRAPG